MTTLIELRDNGHPTAACNARCHNSKSHVCDCICNGLNHGVGLAQAITNTRDRGQQEVANYVANHPHTQTSRLYFHLPPIPVNQPLLF